MKELEFVAGMTLLIGIASCTSEIVIETTPETTENRPSSINRVVDTGQNLSYDQDGNVIAPKERDVFYGQDAQYAGIEFSFEESDDGTTITDLNTGLIWQKTPSDEQFSWEDAQAYCESLELAGRDNWRTPSLKELISIEDFESGWPYINTDYFSLGNQPINKDLQFWSSNFYNVGTAHGGLESSFGLNYGTGHIKAYPAGGGAGDDNMPPPPVGRPAADQDGARPPRGNPATKFVRCVSGTPYGVNQFVDNGDGTITDQATGLMWMKEDSSEGLDWENALAYAENLEYAGYADWRLPNIKELQGIVDYSGVYPAIDSTYFNISDQDAYFWSSTSAYFSEASEEASKHYWAWYVAFGYAVGPDGEDSHGAGAVRFDTKAEGGPAGEDAERVYNYVRAVRTADR